MAHHTDSSAVPSKYSEYSVNACPEGEAGGGGEGSEGVEEGGGGSVR